MPRHQHTWTTEETDALRELFNKGAHSWIAVQLNKRFGTSFTKSAVVGRCHIIGLKKLSQSDFDRAKAIGRLPRKSGKSKAKNVRKSILGTNDVKPCREGRPGRKLIEAFDRFASADHLGISFYDLEPQHCRFPKGEGLNATYCGQPVKEGQSYCERCYSICYTRPPSPEEKKRAA